MTTTDSQSQSRSAVLGSVKLVLGSLFLIVLTTRCSHGTESSYRFSGMGTVSNLSHLGVEGETVTVEFTYSASDFHRTSFSSTSTAWMLTNPIELDVVGSISNDTFDPLPAYRLLLHTTNNWNYLEFQTGGETAIGGSLARADSPTFNSQLSVPESRTFADTHQIFLNELAAGGVWQIASNATILTTGVSTGTFIPIPQSLKLNNYNWSITEVPEPTTAFLAGIGLLGLFSRRGPRTRSKTL